jgi:hypothetical protein
VLNSYPLYLDYWVFWIMSHHRWHVQIWLGESLIAEFISPLIEMGSVEELQWLYSVIFPTIFGFNLVMAFTIFLFIWTSKGIYNHIRK